MSIDSTIAVALEQSISRERLSKYLNFSNQDIGKALELYQQNMLVSQNFYAPLQCVEITLRNKINTQMCAIYGDQWIKTLTPPLKGHSIKSIENILDTYKKHASEVSAGKIVADSKFSFWVSLLGPTYDSTLWRKCLYKGFLAKSGLKRKTVHGRFNAIRRFRNRVMHHEPVIFNNVENIYAEIFDAINWMCTDTANWMDNIYRQGNSN